MSALMSTPMSSRAATAARVFHGSALVALLAVAPGVHAGEPAGATASAAGSAQGAPATFVPGFGFAAPPAKLDGARGGTDGMVASAALRGAVSGNSATHVVTGGNTIQAGAFADATGIPIVIQNSGANVLIQNATVINLQFRE